MINGLLLTTNYTNLQNDERIILSNFTNCSAARYAQVPKDRKQFFLTTDYTDYTDFGTILISITYFTDFLRHAAQVPKVECPPKMATR